MTEQQVFGVPGWVKVVNFSSKDTNYNLKFYVYQKNAAKQYSKMEKVLKALTGLVVTKYDGSYGSNGFIVK